MIDSRVIRYAIVSQDLATGGFSAKAVVTLESVPGTHSPRPVFEQNRANLVEMLGASDLSTEGDSTADGKDPTYQRDAEEIVAGFQMLLPGG